MVEACLARAAEVGMALVMVAETLVGDMAKVTAVEGEGGDAAVEAPLVTVTAYEMESGYVR